MSTPESFIRISTFQALIIAGGLAGAAIIANWRDLTGVSTSLAVMSESLKGIDFRLQAVEAKLSRSFDQTTHDLR